MQALSDPPMVVTSVFAFQKRREVNMTNAHREHPRRFRAVGFDLLTALVDSWSLWIEVAGHTDQGKQWRRASLRRVTSAGDYADYEKIVHQAAEDVGLNSERANRLIQRWAAGELRPWP